MWQLEIKNLHYFIKVQINNNKYVENLTNVKFCYVNSLTTFNEISEEHNEIYFCTRDLSDHYKLAYYPDRFC